jgi:hypothetical protein
MNRIVHGRFPVEPLGGQPELGLAPSVPTIAYQVAYQRAFEAALWAMPAVHAHRLRTAIAGHGARENEVLVWPRLTARMELVAPSNDIPLILSYCDLKNGPVVVELPPAGEEGQIRGQIVDAWHIAVAEISSHEDGSAAAKFVIVPPDFEGTLPEGYTKIPARSFRLSFIFRQAAAPARTTNEALSPARAPRIYYLSEAERPADGVSFPSDQRFSALPFYDDRFFNDIHDIVANEPARACDRVMIDMLATLGIERGRPFNPDERTRRVLKRAVTDVYFYLQERFWSLEPSRMVWPKRHYREMLRSRAPNENEYATGSSIRIDEIAQAVFSGLRAPPPQTEERDVFLVALADRNGQPFKPGACYRVRVPADMPVTGHWSLTVQDAATCARIYSPIDRTSLGSQDKPRMSANSDGSVSIYAGPKPPVGLESNWLPTEGKRPCLVFRLCGTKPAYHERSFVLPDFQLIA